MSFWNAIIESNTFNFAILMLIFAIIFKKLDLASVIEKLKNNISESIENAKLKKENSIQRLKDAQNLVQGLDKEISDRLQEASKKAEAIENQILKNTEIQKDYIEKNINNIISSEEKTIGAKAIEKTLKSASKRAEEKVRSILKENPEMHKKLIEKSIEEI